MERMVQTEFGLEDVVLIIMVQLLLDMMKVQK